MNTKTIKLPTLMCLRCNRPWHPTKETMPKQCPHCKSPYWDRPKLALKMDPANVKLRASRAAKREAK